MNALAKVFYYHGEETRCISILPCRVFESGVGDSNFHSAVWRTELTSVFEDVEQDLLILDDVTKESGVTEVILLVCDRYFYILLL